MSEEICEQSAVKKGQHLFPDSKSLINIVAYSFHQGNWWQVQPI